MDSVTFFIPGKPRGKGRPRFSGGRAYTDEQTRAYEERIAWNYRRIAGKFRFPDDVFLRVRVQQQMPVPQSASKAKKAEMLEGGHSPPQSPTSITWSRRFWMASTALHIRTMPESSGYIALRFTATIRECWWKCPGWNIPNKKRGGVNVTMDSGVCQSAIPSQDL